MENKTKVHAEEGKQELFITRDFELPIDLLFKAYEEAELIEQWMSNDYTTMKVVKLDSQKHGGYQLEATAKNGNVVFRANGVIHEFVSGQKIIRSFEMEGTPYGVQLEVYEFEKLGEDKSRLRMHVIYESVAQRDEVLKLPFAQGINLAHNRIEAMLSKSK